MSASPLTAPAGSSKASRRRARTVRIVSLGTVLVAITALGLAHQRGVNIVGVDALCPFGGIETFWSLVAGGTLLQRIAASSVVLFAAVLGTALLFRRSFCGTICPLGAVQEFFGKIGGAMFRGKRPRVPAAIDRPARWIKYIVLVGFTVWTWQAATLVMRPFDPWVAWMHLTSAELLAEFSIGAAVLGLSIAGSVVYDRFFCKYLCPTGAFLGAISRFSVFKVRREAETCTSCHACDKACPTNVSVSTVDVVNDAECINCNECVNACPVAGTLSISSGGSSPKVLGPLTVLGLTTAILLGAVGLATATGTFAWSPASLAQSAEKSGGTLNPEDIRGSMSFAEISKASGIPETAFQERFKITPAELGMPIKDLASEKGFDVHTDVREFVKEHMSGAK